MSQDPVSSKQVYPAQMFNRATIVCPSCRKLFHDAASKCPGCGFDAHQSVKNFPYTPPVLERVMDHAGVLGDMGDELRGDLDLALEPLLIQFPQISFSFCMLELDESASVSELGFWMMNACGLQDGEGWHDRAWSLLMIIDVKGGQIGLTPGYAIEAFIDDAKWEKALHAMAGMLASADYRNALLGFVGDAMHLLQESARNVRMKVSPA